MKRIVFTLFFAIMAVSAWGQDRVMGGYLFSKEKVTRTGDNRAARQARFNSSDKDEVQVGTITYNFKLM